MKITVSKGKRQVPVRLCLYGEAGVGKSTLVSHIPDVLYIDLEDGTSQLDVARLPKPETFEELLDEIEWVKQNASDFKTLVIDTIDRVEMLLEDYICRKGGKASIEDFGFQSGKRTSIEKMGKFTLLLDEIIAKGLNVVTIGHAECRRYKTPEDEYDKWALSIREDSASKVMNWADIVCFCNFETTLIKTGQGFNERNKAIDKKRMMHFEAAPTYFAKNRYGLPANSTLSYEPLKPVFEGKLKKQDVPVLDITTNAEGIIDNDNPVEIGISELFTKRLAENGKTIDQYNEWSVSRGKPPLEADSEPHIQAMLENIDLLIEQL